MGKKLYVGNLSYSVNDARLDEVFRAFGNVQSAKVIIDRDSGKSKGFGFVEMSSDEEALACVEGLNQQQVDGRQITVSEARPQAPREGGGGGGGGGFRANRGGGGGGYGGGGGGGGGDRRHR